MFFTRTNSPSIHRSSQRILLWVITVLAGLVFAQAALASDITVGSPLNGATATSPLLVRAHNVGCNGLSPTAFAFSIDSSTQTIWGSTAYDIDVTSFTIAPGTHSIHFKGWTSAGICPVVTTSVNISGSTATSSTSSGNIPSNAVATNDLDTSGSWQGEHDAGTPGTSQGSTVFPATTPVYDDARKFYMTYTSRGGERWHLSFAKDASSTHFVLDTYVYVANPDQLANLELDLNQVMSNGKTVIFGTQCSNYSGTWEYTYYSSGFHWHTSNIPCTPRTWAANTWHHIQIAFHRDSSGNATHDWVSVDGKQTSFSGATGMAAASLGWATGSLVLNVQMDGYSKTSGSVTSYFHKTTFYRW
jgi:hypothetical protein